MSSCRSEAPLQWPEDILPESEYRAVWKRVQPDFAASMERQHIDLSQAELLARVYLPLAAWVLAHKSDRPFVLGVNGAQGSGKSTLCEFLALVLERGYGCKVAGFSIDDIYKTRAERVQLAREVHPLLLTRGVPGTHDVQLGIETIERLISASNCTSAALPSFDKAVDDRRLERDWPRTATPVDIVVFEGWCVGCSPQDAEDLTAPLNALEADEDSDGRWRCYVNDQLKGPYAALFERLDRLVMLRVPSMESVFEWRSLQERKLAARIQQAGASSPYLMDEIALRRFIMHYERLTRHTLKEMPGRADIVLFLDDAHRFTHVCLND